MGLIVASAMWAICTYTWAGRWECIEYKHTSITEGYCLVQRYRGAGEAFESDKK